MDFALLYKIVGWLAVLTPAVMWVVKVVAEKAAEKVMRKYSDQLDAAVKQAGENKTKLTELQTDVKWIREALIRFEQKDNR